MMAMTKQRPRPIYGHRGMVAAGHPLAAADGLSVLEAGGNAVDAAIAAAATLAIVSPHECGLGGDLFALVYEGHSGVLHGLNASGKSPAAATLAQFPDGMPAMGPRSVSVPGMIGGWQAALERFGTRSLGELLAGAIRHAEDGFPAYDGLIENAMERSGSIFADPNCKALFFPEDRPLRAGEPLRQPGAAATLRAVAKYGAPVFYRGFVADALAAYVQGAGGLLSAEDLCGFEPIWQAPVEADFCGYRICTMPPNSWGAALLVQLLSLEREGVAGDDEAAFLLQGIRTRRLAYKALAGCIADPEAAGDRARAVVAQFAREGRAPGSLGSACEPGGTDTSQVLVVDAQGNAVSLLQSVFAPFGSGVYAPESGVLCNNRMRGFSTNAADANCVAPNKRPAQTLTPVLALKDGRLAFVCATPGGPGQTGTLAQFLSRTLAMKQHLAEAIAAPRWSMTPAGQFILEDIASEPVRRAVLAAEPDLKVARWGAVNFGSLAAIVREDGRWVGCVDTRRHAAVKGL